MHRGPRRSKRRGVREQARPRVRACGSRMVDSRVCRQRRRNG
jgi:hypothetical protein